MDEYENLGHMSEIPTSELRGNNVAHYLPHYAITKDGSTIMKVGVVFDGSAKTSKLSVNDVQQRGPIIQENLVTIVINDLHHVYILTTYIEKMVRQLKINTTQQDFQNIVERLTLSTIEALQMQHNNIRNKTSTLYGNEMSSMDR